MFLSRSKNSYSGDSITNINFENVILEGDGKYVSIIGSGYELLDNIHLNGCDIQSSFECIGEAFVGGIVADGYILSNCSVTNTKVRANGKNNDGFAAVDVYVGGIAAKAAKIENCYVENSEIISDDSRDENFYLGNGKIYVGGLVSVFDGSIMYNPGSISNSYVRNSEIICSSLDAYEYDKYVDIDFINTGTKTVMMYVGGLASAFESDAIVENCYAANNKIKTISVGDFLAGGFGAKSDNCNFRQCFVYDNSIDCCYKGIESNPHAKGTIGGFLADCNLSSLISCLSLVGDISSSSDDDKMFEYFNTGEKIFSLAEMCNETENSTYTYCATRILSEDRIRFHKGDVDLNTFMECYATYDDPFDDYYYPGYEYIKHSFWDNSADVKNKFKLKGEHWDIIFE